MKMALGAVKKISYALYVKEHKAILPAYAARLTSSLSFVSSVLTYGVLRNKTHEMCAVAS